ANGLIASDSQNVSLHDLNIHGLANEGIKAGRLTNYTVTNVRIYANGFAGWDNDIRNGVKTADTSDHGSMTFSHVEIGFNGCGEYYPVPSTNAVYGCWGQNEGGYGDGLGSGPTSGNWSFQDVYVHHNSQDGLDLLYADGTGSIVMNRVRAEGNAGNQLKVAGQATLTNSIIIGNCSYTADPANMGGGYMDNAGDICRAGGDAIALLPGSDVNNTPVQTLLQDNTITGEGNGLVVVDRGNVASTVTLTSNILLGQPNWALTAQGFPEQASGPYLYSTPLTSIVENNNILWNTKDVSPCPIDMFCKAPLLTNEAINSFNAVPLANSPVIGAASASNSTISDYYGNQRPSSSGNYDIGAIQITGTAPQPIPVQKGTTLCIAVNGTAVTSILGPCTCTSTACK
ncbi:MAG: choice-of-anchor Q domain-containing protein, partial [Candidatus Dormibacteria bacterium]